MKAQQVQDMSDRAGITPIFFIYFIISFQLCKHTEKSLGMALFPVLTQFGNRKQFTAPLQDLTAAAKVARNNPFKWMTICHISMPKLIITELGCDDVFDCDDKLTKNNNNK